jgi:hypothetical protein
MWFAITANSLPRDKKEIRKEYFSEPNEVVLSAETRELLEKKLKESIQRYPEQTEKYLRAGIKIVEADTINAAKKKAKYISKYFNHTGQYSIL